MVETEAQTIIATESYRRDEFFVFNSNVTIDSNMLRAALDCGVSRFVYVGTACSYPAEMQSALDPPPFKEADAYPASPESSYGWCKLMGEYACELLQREGRMDIGILRLHNVYGPRCDMAPETSRYAAVQSGSQHVRIYRSVAQPRR